MWYLKMVHNTRKVKKNYARTKRKLEKEKKEKKKKSCPSNVLSRDTHPYNK